MSLSIIILAAGKGTRMRSAKPKVLHELGGKALLKHVIDTSRALQPNNIYVVIGHGSDQVKQALSDEAVVWVEQNEQKGTGHAVQQAMPHIDADDDVLVLYGDVPLTRVETLQAVMEVLSQASICLLTAILDNPHGYGRIVRDDAQNLSEIVEQKDANEEQLSIQEINTGILAARADKLQALLKSLSNDNAQGEYYLTDIVAGGRVAELVMRSVSVNDFSEVSGINDRQQLATLERHYQNSLAQALMLTGVTLSDPARIDIRGSLTVGEDSFIDSNCQFIGENTFGKNVSIGPNCVFVNAQIGEGVCIEANTVIENAVVGKNSSIGPFARLRPGSVLEANVKIGNFVETKNSKLGEGSKANHLSYVGDSMVGGGVNIGAGTITANYDGANKHKTTVKDNASIGANSVLVAPVIIGENATVGAGSVITRDIDDDQLTLTRAKVKTVDNWQRPQKK